jgi:hypothetical protein
MHDANVKDLSNEELREYADDLKNMSNDPEYYDSEEERQVHVDRLREIEAEKDRRELS